MKRICQKNKIQASRKERTRSKIDGSGNRPRLSVFRSYRHIYAQLIDDAAGRTLASASSLKLKSAKKVNKTSLARQVGAIIGESARQAGIKQAIFDRGSYKYHGRVKAVAEGAKEAGLKI